MFNPATLVVEHLKFSTCLFVIGKLIFSMNYLNLEAYRFLLA